MSMFLLIYFSVYGTAHLYFFWKVRMGFTLGWRSQTGLGAFLLLMILAPMMARLLERRDLLWPARGVSTLGFLWMALLFWFCCLGAVTEIWNLGARGVAFFHPSARRVIVAPRPMVLAAGAIILIATVWGFLEASRIRCVEYAIQTRRMSPDAAPVRVALIGDVHLSFTVGERRLSRILRLIEEAQPDVVLCAGDLTDLRFENSKRFAVMFKTITPPLGKYAVTGNHEFYVGLDSTTIFHGEAGFRLLREESVLLGDRLLVAGVDDSAGIRTRQACRLNEDAVLPSGDNRPFTILLKHRPHVIASSVGRFDLQMSGHGHGGQIFPFGLITRWANSYGAGLHPLAKGSQLYVTRGTGTWGPPLRLFAPPEVTLFVIEPEAAR